MSGHLYGNVEASAPPPPPLLKDPVDGLPMQHLTFEEVQKNPALLHGGGGGMQNGKQGRTKTSTTSSQGKERSRPRQKRNQNATATSETIDPSGGTNNGKTANGTAEGPKKGVNGKSVKKPAVNGAATNGIPKGPKKNEANTAAGPSRKPPSTSKGTDIANGPKARLHSTPSTTNTARTARQRNTQRSGNHKRLKGLSQAIYAALQIDQMEREQTDEARQALLWSQTGSRTEVDQMERLGRQMQGLWQSTRPTQAQAAARATLIRDVDAALERRWPGCGLHVVPFGSTLTGLVEADSDVDLCLIDPTRPFGVGTPSDQVVALPEGAAWEPLRNTRITGMSNVPDYYSVRLIGHSLEHFSNRGRFASIQPIQHANVPIVKFRHLSTRLDCDLNVNDTFGLYNSHMIREYIDIAPAVMQPFIFTIKKWASRREINDPSGDSGVVTLNSYTVVLFALQYLQTVGLVPNLQDKNLLEALAIPRSYLWQKPKGKGVIAAAANAPDNDGSTAEATSSGIIIDSQTGARKFDTTFAKLKSDDDVRLAESISMQRPTGKPFQISRIQDQNEIGVLLGTLLIGFFDWLHTFDFDLCGLSLREGHPVRRHADTGVHAHLQAWPFVAPQDPRWTDNTILCQDPFITDRNTSSAILKRGTTDIRSEIERGHELLKKDGQSLLVELLAPRRREMLAEELEAYTKNLNAEEKDAFDARLTQHRQPPPT